MKDPIIENKFTYHKPEKHQPEKYEKIRAKAKEFAYLINELCPTVHWESNYAIKKLEEAVFWANAAIARHDEEGKLK